MADAPAMADRRLQRSHGTGRLKAVAMDGRSRLKTLYQEGSAKLRVPKAHRDGALEAVMINTAGGMTGGDLYHWQFEAGAGAGLIVTTQACEKVYRSAGGVARTDILVTAGEGAQFTWLPQETILFDNCAFARTITADLDATASALFVEPMIFGRRSMGETVRRGLVRDRWRIRVGGRLVHAEDFHIGADVRDTLDKPAAAAGRAAFATILLIAPEPERYLASARELIGDAGSASAWNGKLLARIRETDGYSLRERLVPVLNLLNPDNRMPKVWAI